MPDPPSFAEIIKSLEAKPRVGYSPSEWLSTFRTRIRCVIPASKVDGDLTNFPVLISLSSSSGIGSEDLTYVFDENGGEDLKVAVTTSDGVTQCPVEVVSWDSGGETAELWTKLPSISSTVDTVFYFYFDDNIADNSSYVGVTGSAIAETVWDANFKLVCHMEDNPDTSSVMDSTSNDNDGAKKAANEPVEVTGKIGKAQDFDGTHYINFGNGTYPTGKLTIETWFKTTQDEDINDCLLVQDVAGYDYIHGYNNGLIFYVVTASGTTACNPTLNNIFNDGSWHHLASVYDKTLGSDRLKVYFDGDLKKSADGYAEDIRTPTGDLICGSRYNSLDNGLPATIDFLSLSHEARSAAWIKASYESQNNSFVSYQEKQYRSPFFMEAINNLGR